MAQPKQRNETGDGTANPLLRLHRIKETALILRVSEKAVRHLIRTGELVVVQGPTARGTATQPVIEERELQAYIERHRQPRRAQAAEG
jgi:hypothetical protein